MCLFIFLSIQSNVMLFELVTSNTITVVWEQFLSYWCSYMKMHLIEGLYDCILMYLNEGHLKVPT